MHPALAIGLAAVAGALLVRYSDDQSTSPSASGITYTDLTEEPAPDPDPVIGEWSLTHTPPSVETEANASLWFYYENLPTNYTYMLICAGNGQNGEITPLAEDSSPTEDGLGTNGSVLYQFAAVGTYNYSFLVFDDGGELVHSTSYSFTTTAPA